MIVKEDDPSRLPQFNRALTRLQRRNRTIDAVHTPIISARPRKSRPISLATYRARRNAFLNRLAFAWSTTNPDSGGAFTALAAAINPWVNWDGTTVTLSAFQAFVVYWSYYFQDFVSGALDPTSPPMAPDAYPTNWKTPIVWDPPIFDFGVNPITVTMTHPSMSLNEIPVRLELYLAAPAGRFYRDPLQAPLLCYSNVCPLDFADDVTSIWHLPNDRQIYPYALPTGPTPAAVRPQNGQTLDPISGNYFLECVSANVYKFTHPNPSQ